MRRVVLGLSVFLLLASTANAGFVVSAGSDEHYQLGTGYKTKGSSTVFVPSLVDGAIEVCGAGWWGAARLESGQVETWGGNEQGQSGTGVRSPSRQKPVLVPGITDAAQIACGGQHVVVLHKNGTVSGWGSDTRGQQCDGREGIKNPEVKPYLIPGLSNVVEVSAGGADSWFLLANGTVEGCGEDGKGQLGDGTAVPGRSHIVNAKLSNIKAISGGGAALSGADLLAITKEGSVVGIGANNVGQLGDGTKTSSLSPVPVRNLSHVRAVSASSTNSLAVTESGELYAWGDDRFGEIGSEAHSTCGHGAHAGPCQLIPQKVGIGSTGIIHAGVHHSFATVNGRLFAWGNNEQGQLGDGTKTGKSTPTGIDLFGVTDIGGEGSTSFLVTSEHVIPAISVFPVTKGLTVNWTSTDSSEPWTIAHRLVGSREWGKGTKLQPAARSTTISGLQSDQEYEVRLSAQGFGTKIATGVAG